MFQQEGSARRTETSGVSVLSGSAAWAVATMRLSEAAARFLSDQEHLAGNRRSTLLEYASAFWYMIDFLGADPPIGELPADFGRRWIEWLRMTPIQPRKPWSRPKRVSPQTVAGYLAEPPQRCASGAMRAEQTIGRFWRMGRPFLQALGLDVRLPQKRRGVPSRDHAPRLKLPPPLVPRRSEIAGWWRETLDPAHGTASAAVRRRVVLMQAACLLTGCRLGELLAAQTDFVEDHWLLLHPDSVKTGQPRLVYLTSQALGICAALRQWTLNGQRLMFDVGARGRDRRELGASEFVVGWPYSESWWHKQVRICLPESIAETPQAGRELTKRHQSLRKVCSDWLNARDPVAERAQLGHGGTDVVSTSYLDVLRRLPRRMERRPMRLPDLSECGFCWPKPIDAPQHVPRRLYREFRRLVEE